MTLESLAQSHPVFIQGILVLLLIALALLMVWLASRIIGVEFERFLRILKSEREENARGQKTMGARNWACVITVTLFCAFTIAAGEFGEVLEIIRHYLGIQRADPLIESITVTNYVYSITVIVVVSLLSTLALEIAKSRR